MNVCLTSYACHRIHPTSDSLFTSLVVTCVSDVCTPALNWMVCAFMWEACVYWRTCMYVCVCVYVRWLISVCAFLCVHVSSVTSGRWGWAGRLRLWSCSGPHSASCPPPGRPRWPGWHHQDTGWPPPPYCPEWSAQRERTRVVTHKIDHYQFHYHKYL